jgi:hypothetical protein
VMVRLMSDGELTRLEVLRDLDQKRLTTQGAGRLLELGRRQVFRLLKAYLTEGSAGLISKRRGRRSNRQKPEALRGAVLAIIREWYWDFGPTLAAEKLCEVHGITLGRETLRLWMIEAGLWRDRKQQATAKARLSAALSARLRRRSVQIVGLLAPRDHFHRLPWRRLTVRRPDCTGPAHVRRPMPGAISKWQNE